MAKNKSSTKGKGPLKMRWKSRADEYDFLRGGPERAGGVFGVMITIDLKDAKKLSKDIKQCVDRAEYWKKDEIKLIAHWGKKYPKGFLLETKVSTPGENEEES